MIVLINVYRKKACERARYQYESQDKIISTNDHECFTVNQTRKITETKY